MKLIVGLGNPGEQYKNNRHNVGFMLVDYMVEKEETLQQFQLQKSFQAEVAIIMVGNEKVLLAKPQTYMNLSGISVSKIMNFYKVPLENLYIVHDDLDISLGKYKVQKSVGPKLHNGIESIEKYLGTKDFWRYRIGVDNRGLTNRISGEAYVLQDFTQEERNMTEEVFNNLAKSVAR